jgi:transcriptional repressor NrdR
MRCPYCTHIDTRVIDSRFASEGEQVRRRRQCERCKERFTTYETAELSMPRIIKSRDKARESFSEEKLRAGLDRALRKRPVETERVDAAIARIKRRLRESGEREIGSGRIGNWVMEELRDLDHVAYIRFASVYRSFGDVRAFLDEIAGLENVLPPEVKRSQLHLALQEGGTPPAAPVDSAKRAGKKKPKLAAARPAPTSRGKR